MLKVDNLKSGMSGTIRKCRNLWKLKNVIKVEKTKCVKREMRKSGKYGAIGNCLKSGKYGKVENIQCVKDRIVIIP